MNEEQADKMIELLSDIKDQLVTLTDRVEAVEKEIGDVGEYMSGNLDTISTQLTTIDESIGNVDSSLLSVESSIDSVETAIQLKD
jgi:archaellum component FlaC